METLTEPISSQIWGSCSLSTREWESSSLNRIVWLKDYLIGFDYNYRARWKVQVGNLSTSTAPVVTPLSITHAYMSCGVCVLTELEAVFWLDKTDGRTNFKHFLDAVKPFLSGKGTKVSQCNQQIFNWTPSKSGDYTGAMLMWYASPLVVNRTKFANDVNASQVEGSEIRTRQYTDVNVQQTERIRSYFSVSYTSVYKSSTIVNDLSNISFRAVNDVTYDA